VSTASGSAAGTPTMTSASPMKVASNNATIVTPRR
jgi:hypothetical protein